LRNPLSPLTVRKIFDNLRRSLVSPALLVLLAGGWLLGPGPAWFWILLAGGVVFFPVLSGTSVDFIRKSADRKWSTHLLLAGKAAGRSLAHALLGLVMLPYDIFIYLSAILYSSRMLYTRRGLLIWYLPSYARRNACQTLPAFYREMWVTPVLASTLALLLWHIGGALWIFNASLLLLWLASPAVAWWISRPLELPPPDLSAEQKRFLRASARRTWRYFEDFTGPEHNWLTPDNMQEFPVSAVAARTSPTNIGMSLLANLAAWDFGYISARELLRRTDHTLATLLKLKRHRGHFYNWYDTHTLEPLRPHYISSVDSGNLVGCLLTLQAGLAEVKNCPLFTTDAWCGLRDTALVLTEQLPASLAPQLARQLDGLLYVRRMRMD
jgi:hypothetical protein